MHKSNKHSIANLWQIFTDIIIIIISYISSYMISSRISVTYSITKYLWIPIIFVPLCVLVMRSLKMYNRTTFNYYDRIFRNVLISILFSGTCVALLSFFIKEAMYNKILLASFICLSAVLLMIERCTYVHYIKKFRGSDSKQVIIVGSTKVASKLKYYIKKTNLKFNVLGYVHVSGDKYFKSVNNLGNIEDLEKILVENVVDEVIFTLPKDYVGSVEKYVLLCEEMGITVRIVLDLYDLKISKPYLTSIGPLPMLIYNSVSLDGFQLFVKRVMDIAGALVGIIITSIVSIFVVIAMKIDSPGPIFFTQDRVGRNGRIFKVYKFRSMYIDAEERKKDLMEQNEMSDGLMFKMKSDPRITRVGNFLRKTSLDELPQFLNVFKGDMSLVGTRPPTVDEVSNYETHHHRRISIKPGITGMWQVSGRSQITDFDEVVKLDTSYIDNWSIWLDIKILFKTVFAVFRKKGAM